MGICYFHRLRPHVSRPFAWEITDISLKRYVSSRPFAWEIDVFWSFGRSDWVHGCVRVVKNVSRLLNIDNFPSERAKRDGAGYIQVNQVYLVLVTTFSFLPFDWETDVFRSFDCSDWVHRRSPNDGEKSPISKANGREEKVLAKIKNLVYLI